VGDWALLAVALLRYSFIFILSFHQFICIFVKLVVYVDWVHFGVSNSNSNSERQCSWCCHHDTANARVHPVHLMNIGWVLGSHRPLDQARWPQPQIRLHCQLHYYIWHHHLLLFSSKADAHFAIPFRVEGRADGWLVTYRDGLPAHSVIQVTWYSRLNLRPVSRFFPIDDCKVTEVRGIFYVKF